MGEKACLRCKGLAGWVGVVNKLLKTKRLLTSPSNVLPLHLKPPIIWIFIEGEGDGIESRLPFKKISTLWNYEDYNLEDCSRYYIFWGSRRALVSGQRLLRNLIKRLLDVRYLLQAVHNGDITLMELHLYFHANFYTFKCFTKITDHFLKFLVSTSNYN